MKKPNDNVVDLFPDITKDPLHLRARVYRQYGRLLNLMEDTEAGDEDGMTIPQLINALKALNEYDLKTVRGPNSGSSDAEPAGSAVRRYAKAFKNAASRRKTGAGSSSDTDAFDDSSDSDDVA